MEIILNSPPVNEVSFSEFCLFKFNIARFTMKCTENQLLSRLTKNQFNEALAALDAGDEVTITD